MLFFAHHNTYFAAAKKKSEEKSTNVTGSINALQCIQNVTLVFNFLMHCTRCPENNLEQTR